MQPLLRNEGPEKVSAACLGADSPRSPSGKINLGIPESCLPCQLKLIREKPNPDPSSWGILPWASHRSRGFTYIISNLPNRFARRIVLPCGQWGNKYREVKKKKKKVQDHETSKCWAGTYTRMTGPKAWNIHGISLKLSPYFSYPCKLPMTLG